MKAKKATYIGNDEQNRMYFEANGSRYSCKENILVDYGIEPNDLKIKDEVFLHFDLAKPTEIKRVQRTNNHNFYLEFYKHKLYKMLKRDGERIEKIEGKHIKSVPKPNFNKGTYKQLIPAVTKRQLKQAKAVCEEIHAANFKPEWHLALGLGIPSVFETSINLHHLYGVPYINGSTLKGAVRAFVVAKYFEGNEGKAIENSKDFCDLFGCPKKIAVENKEEKKDDYTSIYKEERAGQLIFFDALPSNPKVQIIEDILNPHFDKYYNEEAPKPPADWQMPVPINFLVVKNTPFQFIIGLKKGKENKTVSFDGKQFSTIDFAQQMLKEALTEGGIGAKTSVGYGYMKVV